jgi:hypothetical protein
MASRIWFLLELTSGKVYVLKDFLRTVTGNVLVDQVTNEDNRKNFTVLCEGI